MKTTTRRWRVYTTAFVVGLSLICMTAVAGCAPQSGSSDGGSTQTAASGEWTESSDCTSCHATEASSGTDTSCLYSKHASVACNTCHTNSDGKLATAHEDYATAKAPTKLKKTEVSSEMSQLIASFDSSPNEDGLGTEVPSPSCNESNDAIN